MSLQMRWVGTEDLDRVAETRWMCYAHAQKDLQRYRDNVRLDPRSQPGDFLLAERDGIAVGTATSLPLKIWVRGAQLPCQGVAYVGTVKTARRRHAKTASSDTGIAFAVMNETLRMAGERGLVLTALMPFRASYYEHFGYGIVESRNEWTLPMPVLPEADTSNWRFASQADRPAIAQLWQRCVELGQCDFERSEARRTHRQLHEEDGMLFIDRPSPAGPIVASAFITHEFTEGRNLLKIQEFSAPNPESFQSLLAFCKTLRDQFSAVSITTPTDWPVNHLLTEPQIPHRPVDHPVPDLLTCTRMQLRILDHKKYLESLHLPESVQGRLTIAVAESEGHTSRFTVDFDAGHASVAPSQAAADFECTDRNWAAIATGQLPAPAAILWNLARQTSPKATQLLSCLAAGPKPFSREYF